MTIGERTHKFTDIGTDYVCVFEYRLQFTEMMLQMVRNRNVAFCHAIQATFVNVGKNFVLGHLPFHIMIREFFFFSLQNFVLISSTHSDILTTVVAKLRKYSVLDLVSSLRSDIVSPLTELISLPVQRQLWKKQP